MSLIWWHPRRRPHPPGVPPPPLDPGEAWDTPGTLLRIPPPFQAAPARRRSAPPLQPAGRRDCWHGTVGTPSVRRELVMAGKAQSVELRGVLLSPTWLPPAFRGRGDPGEEPEGEPAGGGTPSPGIDPAHALAIRLALALQPPPETLLRPAGVLEWPAPFFPYQREGIRALLQCPHLLLADDMGLGKSVQVIAALRVLLVRREIERALIVVPASLIEQWRRELDRWAPELRVMVVAGTAEERLWQWQYRAHVTLTSYDTLRSDYTFSARSGPCRETWGVVVLDEAQRVKNRESDTARACKGLPRRRSWAATGTPLENRSDDTASILEFVAGEAVPASLPGLQAALARLQLRRRKADVLRDLPPKIATELTLPLTAGQRRTYLRAEREGVLALREERQVRIEHVLALITRLKQICNFDPAGGASAKMADLAGRLDALSASGHKALVFTQYAGEQAGAARIAAGLQRFLPVLYTGEMGLAERTQAVRRFQEEDGCRVMILSLRAGGLGLNLQCASYVFHFDRWWNPAVESQAEDRAHRVGQTQPVHVYQYVMAETIEERVAAVLRRKARLFKEIVDTTSMDLAGILDRRDLLALVGIEE